MDQIRKAHPRKVTNNESEAYSAQSFQAPRKQTKANKKYRWIVVALLVLLLIIGCIVASYLMLFKKKTDTHLVGVNSDQYQALFLTNGQVYFGKLSQLDKETIKINNIFYLQVQQPVQPKDDKQQNETQLIKLGEELHGPNDEMFVNRSQVLFWENIKDNGKVGEAIKSYNK
ncbi:MAG: hypothetical protein H6793_00125 [Candidatus Nomurabacteria bacterium]|nr:MAG: hypothetical protein H6793_00125 [Candidatus Nomurabacteria bacterium]